MDFNTIKIPENKILEVEECEPVSSPSSNSLDEPKSVPYLNSLYSPLYKNFNFPLELNEQKNMSNPISLVSRDFRDIFFGEKTNKNNSLSFQKEEIKYNDVEQENININKLIEDKKDHNNLEKAHFKINKLNPTSSTQNPFQKITDNYSMSLDESDNERISLNSINKNHRDTEKIDRNKLNRLYDCYMNDPKIIPVKEDKRIDSFMDDISHQDSQLFTIKTEDNNILLNKKDAPRTKPIIGELNSIHNSPYFKFRNSNPNTAKGIYFKKKILDSNAKIGKKRQSNLTSVNDLRAEYNKEIKDKKRPIILNINLNKKKLPSLKISQFQRILKNDGLFYLLRFFDYNDFVNLYKARNKQLFILFNTALVYTYFFNIKESLMKYNNFIEILKCSIVHSKIKNAFKIDFVINIRFINNAKINPNQNYKIKLGGPNKDKFVDPLHIQFGYIYNYMPKVKNKKELITKEDYEKQVKRLKMYDYYTFDLYPENTKNNKKEKDNPVFISKELSLFEKDGNNSIVNIQPILPFYINDKGIINLELFTTNNGFIDPESIKFVVKSYNLKKYLKMLAEKEINNPRISECEDLCLHWKNINLFPNHKALIFRLKKMFEPFFTLDKVNYGNIGVNVFRVCLTAIASGEIKEKNKFKLKIRIKEKNDCIENEIRKNNLLFEKRDIFELRVGDQIIFYFPMK